MNQELTHRIPQEIQNKLVEAKKWYEEREELERVIRQYGGSAQRNQEDRDISDRAASGLLCDIVELVGSVWGFA